MLTYVSFLDIVYGMLLHLYQILLKESKSCREIQARNYQLYRFFWDPFYPPASHIPVRPDLAQTAIASAGGKKYSPAVRRSPPTEGKTPDYPPDWAIPAESLRTACGAFFRARTPFFDMISPWRYRPRWLPNPTVPTASPPHFPL